VHSLRGGAADALEGLVRGDQKNSQLIGKQISEINLPEGAQIGAIVRGRHLPDGSLANLAQAQIRIIFPEKVTRIEPWDHLVIFLPNRRSVHAVEKLLNADRD
jgi:trk system potassium uptake protein TrkA